MKHGGIGNILLLILTVVQALLAVITLVPQPDDGKACLLALNRTGSPIDIIIQWV